MYVKHNFDVIIIGAGPAGLTAGYLLTKYGIKCAIIEKDRFPREKLCGGIITNKTFGLIKSIYEEVPKPDWYISRVDVYDKDEFICSSRLTDKLKIVDRKEFDYWLYEKYIESGGVIFEDTRVIKMLKDKCSLITDTCTIFNYKYLVGADGVNSVVRRLINKDFKLSGFCAQITKNTIYTTHIAKVRANTTNKGYTWELPRKKKMVIGTGGYLKDANNIVSYLQNVEAEDGIFYPIKGAGIPYGDYIRNVQYDNIFLIGDAAGLADPITGEGIYYAIKSAKILANCLQCNTKDFVKGIRKLQNEIFINEILKQLFYKFYIYKFCFMLVRRNPKLVDYLMTNVVQYKRCNYFTFVFHYLFNKMIDKSV